MAAGIALQNPAVGEMGLLAALIAAVGALITFTRHQFALGPEGRSRERKKRAMVREHDRQVCERARVASMEEDLFRRALEEIENLHPRVRWQCNLHRWH